MRNKIKRRIRHILIECQHQLVADDFVIIARKGVEELSYRNEAKPHPCFETS